MPPYFLATEAKKRFNHHRHMHEKAALTNGGTNMGNNSWRYSCWDLFLLTTPSRFVIIYDVYNLGMINKGQLWMMKNYTGYMCLWFIQDTSYIINHGWLIITHYSWRYIYVYNYSQIPVCPYPIARRFQNFQRNLSENGDAFVLNDWWSSQINAPTFGFLCSYGHFNVIRLY